jgi:hypothetical protein
MCNLSRCVPRSSKKGEQLNWRRDLRFLRREKKKRKKKKEKRIEEPRHDGSETVYAYYGGVPADYVCGVSILISKLTFVPFAIFLLREVGNPGIFKRRRLVGFYNLEQDGLEAVSSFRLFWT